ncbi:ABC transporter permease [Actinoallomurus spadix]|uniref:ABC transporter permease n=1 Tax=Actinoallomurus spadix TaxID=79912 RepID=A0ABN0WBX0_9ACTN|nr:ABC transporter permease [Actinoallomurus spadix]MCO5990402.1 ABC transporter permease [Actinoallomurus spadix]
MNPVIASITFRAMLSKRRILLLFLLPALLLMLSIGLRASGHADLDNATMLLTQFGLGALLPLLALLAGTGVIGPEIDDGQIMYIMTKPIARPVISTTKYVVSVVLVVAFGVVPMFVAGVIMTGMTAGLATGFALGALVAGVAYCALFLAIAVLSRFAVTIGLIYALVWENLIARYAPGAKTLSIRQWGISVADMVTNATAVKADVASSTAVPLLIVVTVAGVAYAGWKLRTLSVTGTD